MLDCTGRQVQVTSSCTTALKALLTYQMHLQILCQDLHIGTHWASASQPSLPPASTARSPTAAPAHLPWPTCMHARSGAKRPSAIIVRIGANSAHRRRDCTLTCMGTAPASPGIAMCFSKPRVSQDQFLLPERTGQQPLQLLLRVKGPHWGGKLFTVQCSGPGGMVGNECSKKPPLRARPGGG